MQILLCSCSCIDLAYEFYFSILLRKNVKLFTYKAYTSVLGGGVSYGACISKNANRQTDGHQDHPSRPSGLKPALRHLGTRRLLAFTRALHLQEQCIYWSTAFTGVLHLLEYCIYTKLLHLQ